MIKNTGYLLSSEFKDALQTALQQHRSSFQPPRKSKLRPPRLAGTVSGAYKAGLGFTKSVIPGRTGDVSTNPDVQATAEPGVGTVLLFFETGGMSEIDWENWSITPIPKDAVVVAIEIDGHFVIVTAFC